MNTTTPETTALAVSSASAGSLLMSDASMDRLERLAGFMASGKTTLPQHLRGNTGDCFAIALQSMQWGMNPFAVGQKTHLVNGTLGYEAQLVAAVINTSGVVKDRFNFEWFGDWAKIIGRFKEVESRTKKDDNGNPKKFIVPDWKQTDEHGLGVRVWATIKGESQPRVLELLLTQARTRNSTLWTEDPKQQLAYLAQKRWARLHAPDVILGVYTPDELEGSVEKFMGPVEEVPPEAPVTWPDDLFALRLPEWRKAIAAKKATADAIVAKAKTKHALTEQQVAAIRAPITPEETAAAAPKTATPAAAEGPTDVEVKPAPDAPPVTFAQVADAMHKATNENALNEAAGLITAIADDSQRDELNALFDTRLTELQAA